jgi:integrase
MSFRKKRGEMWYVYWKENGKLKAKAVSRDLQATKEFQITLENQIFAKKHNITIKNVKLSVAFEEYITFKKAKSAKRTTLREICCYRQFQEWNKNKIKYIQDLNSNIINEYKLFRQNQNKSIATINKDLLMLKCLLKFAYMRKYISSKDMLEEIKLYRESKASTDYIATDKDIKTLIENTKHPYKTAVIIALYTGMRRGEICHLEWTDIDFEKNMISIKEKQDWKPKNATSTRTIPIQPKLKKYLLEIKKLADNKTNSVLFYTENFETINEDVLTSMIRKIKIKLNLDNNFHLHSLRHLFVSKMAEKGVPVHYISKLVGHSNSIITEQVYTHLKDTSYFKQIEKLSYDLNF